MEIIAAGLHPAVKFACERPASELRRQHAKEAMLHIARTIRDLIAVLPLSFLNGAVNGPILILGTFAFGVALAPEDSTLLGTMGNLAFYAGLATMLLAIIPRIDDCIRKVATDILWVCNPKAMERAALRRQSLTAARVLVASLGVCATLGLTWSYSPKDPLGLEERFAIIPLTNS